jgi:outer membrane lipoprotein carrier protein
MQLGKAEFRSQNSGARMGSLLHAGSRAALFLFVSVFCMTIAVTDSYSVDLETVAMGLQQRYASAVTMSGSFQQTYRAPGIEQIESGVFWMKRPGLMRWEYRLPEAKLFVADGREAFLYVPLDRQVTIQSFSASDMRGTPLEFLLGGMDIRKSFVVSWENNFRQPAEPTLLIRLTPRSGQSDYEYLVLAIDPKNYELRRITMHEHGGNSSEFRLSNLTANAKIDNKQFQFKPPKGTEVMRLEEGK